jgi:hypothetical protein
MRQISLGLDQLCSNRLRIQIISEPRWPIRSKETWTKYTPLTLLRNRKTHSNREKYTFCITNHWNT